MTSCAAGWGLRHSVVNPPRDTESGSRGRGSRAGAALGGGRGGVGDDAELLEELRPVAQDVPRHAADGRMVDSSHGRTLGFSAKELATIQRLVQQHEAELLEAWNDFHGT